MNDQTLIKALLAKRLAPVGSNAELRDRMASVSNDIEAEERVLNSLGYQVEAVTTSRTARINGLLITANILTSLFVDQFGLLGMHAHSQGATHWVGAALMVGGIALIAKF